MKLSDAQLTEVLDRLRQEGQRVTGLAVRRRLREEFGVQGGCARIYRAVRTFRAQPVIPGRLPATEPAASARELAEWQGRAERAEARERDHQVHWAREVDQLRQELLTLQQRYAQSVREAPRIAELQRLLQAAYLKISALEEALIRRGG